MAKKHKVSRKKLLKEPDEFITFSGKLFRWIVRYRVQIYYALGAATALVIGSVGYQYLDMKAEKAASVMLQQSMDKYRAVLKDSGTRKAYSDVEKDFARILDKFSKKDTGKLARLIYANICYNAGEYDKSIELYHQLLEDLGGNLLLKNIVLSNLGYAYEEKKDLGNATKYFEMVASGDDAMMKDDAVFNLGRLYAATGNTDKRQKAFDQIRSNYPDSIYFEIANEM